MDFESVKKSIRNLRNKIAYHNHQYHTLDAPEISDSEYDALFQKLLVMEDKHPELKEDTQSPSSAVGGDVLAKFAKFSHPMPMLSLANVFSDEAFERFDQRVRKGLEARTTTYAAEVKLDGLALELIYNLGKLTVASTRGNGVEGEVITENARTLSSIPEQLMGPAATHARVIIRGEVVIETADFIQLNKKRVAAGEAPFANPRNAAAGSMRQLDTKVTANRPLSFFAYQLANATEMNLHSHGNALHYIESAGVQINPYREQCTSTEDVFNYYQQFQKRRQTLRFEIDGVVFKIDSFRDQQRLGQDARAPKWAIAYKFPAEQVTTIVRDIMIQIGRTGVLTPVAELDCVDVGGVSVSRATLHNEDEIERKDIRIGDTVIVQRAGDVIPEVVASIQTKRSPTSQPFSFPKQCPSCGHNVERDPNEAATRCLNQSGCPAQSLERLRHFVSKVAMDIDGLGQKLIAQLVEEGLVSQYSDLYKLSIETTEGLERMGEKSAQNLIQAIATSRAQPFARVLFALGIRHVGRQTALALTDFFETIEALNSADEEALAAVDDVGPVVAHSLFEYLQQPGNQIEIQQLQAYGLSFQREEKTTKSTRLDGQTVVITGSYDHYKREDLKQMILDHGGRVSSAISSKTNYLLAGEKAGSKLKKAKALSITVITIDSLLQMLGE